MVDGVTPRPSASCVTLTRPSARRRSTTSARRSTSRMCGTMDDFCSVCQGLSRSLRRFRTSSARLMCEAASTRARWVGGSGLGGGLERRPDGAQPELPVLDKPLDPRQDVPRVQVRLLYDLVHGAAGTPAIIPV